MLVLSVCIRWGCWSQCCNWWIFPLHQWRRRAWDCEDWYRSPWYSQVSSVRVRAQWMYLHDIYFVVVVCAHICHLCVYTYMCVCVCIYYRLYVYIFCCCVCVCVCVWTTFVRSSMQTHISVCTRMYHCVGITVCTVSYTHLTLPTTTMV